jgi:hypothetical protein
MFVSSVATTVAAPDQRAAIDPASRAVMRQFAIEYAIEVLYRPVDWADPAGALHEHRHALRVLSDQLRRVDVERQRAINTAGLAQARQMLRSRVRCAGSGEHVNADAVDGSFIATCPTCWRRRPVVRVDDGGRWFAVTEHRTRL